MSLSANIENVLDPLVRVNNAREDYILFYNDDLDFELTYLGQWQGEVAAGLIIQIL